MLIRLPASLPWRRLAVVGAVVSALVGAGGLGLALLARDRAAVALQTRVATLQQRTGWTLRWQSLSLGLPLRVDLEGVTVSTPAGRALVAIERIEVKPGLWAALAGGLEDAVVVLQAPALTIDVEAGDVDALRSLAASVRRGGGDEAAASNGGRRLARVEVSRASARITLPKARPAALPAAWQLDDGQLVAEAEPDDSGTSWQVEGSAQLGAPLGGPWSLSAARSGAGAWRGKAGPVAPLRLALPAVDARLPADLWLALGPDGLRLEDGRWALVAPRLGAGALTWVEAARVSGALQVGEQGPAEAPLVQADAVQFSAPAALHNALTESLRSPPAAATDGAVPLAKPLALPPLPGLGARVKAVAVRRSAKGWQIQAEGVESQVGPSTLALARAELEVAARSDLTRPDRWRAVRLDGPRATIALHDPLLALVPGLADDLRALAARRRSAAERLRAAADKAVEREPAGGPGAKPSGQPPAYGWIASIQAANQRLLALPARLEASWPVARLPAGLKVEVKNASVVLVDEKAQPRLGLRGGELAVDPGGGSERPFRVAATAFDDDGPIGTLGVVGRREADALRFDVRIGGGGVAQLLGDRLGGLAVGPGADLEVVATAHLRRQGLRIEGRAAVARMGIRWWRLANRPIADFGASLTFAAEVRRSPAVMSLYLTDIRVRDARLDASVRVDRVGPSPRVRLEVSAPMQDCGDLLRAVPDSMLPTIGRIDAKGPMSFSAAVNVPLPMVGATAVELALGDTLCTVERFGDIHDDLQGLAGDFVRPVNENGTLLQDVPIGPRSGSWTPAVQIPRHVLYAMWATEDSFFKHRGISERLIAKALAIDLSYGRFIYGGSTVTQQLAKNIYLRRGKALSRKFEEMLIAWQFERVLGKARILELYCNIVELGPKIYGITRAARAYFDKTPAQLTHVEALFLGVIKPRPSGGWGHFKARAWSEWFSEKIGKYMDKYVEEGMLTQAERDAALPFRPVFADPATARARMGGSGVSGTVERAGASPRRGR